MKLVFDDQALLDIESIFDWIARDSSSLAKKVIDELFSSVELLISFPFMGHVGHDSRTLEREQDRIIVTAIFHGAQDRERPS